MLILPRNIPSAIDRRFRQSKHPNFFGLAIVGLLAFFATLMIILISRAAGGTIILTPPTGPATGGTSVTMAADPNGPQWSNQVLNYPFGGTASTTGMEQQFIVPVTGNYKLEAWGAQGSNTATGGLGGKGGYSTTTVRLNAGQTVYIAVGGAGGVDAAGWNGGGAVFAGGTGGSGGGSTHMSLATAAYTTANRNGASNLGNATVRSATNLLLVAGGGGGSQGGGPATCIGGAGGGTTGQAGINTGCTGGTSGGGGTQSAGGSAGNPGGNPGTQGFGGFSTQQGGSTYGGGGGGGYWGGGSGQGGRGGSAGGGSGYVPTTINSQAATGNSSIAGNLSITDPDGSTVTGHSGNGYARITILETGLYVKPTVQFGTVTIADANVTWCNYNGSICTNGGAPNTVTFTTPPRNALPAANNVWLTFDPTTTGTFTYWTPATSYTNQCTIDSGSTWGTQRNISAGVAVTCRIVLNNAFSGTISLADNYSSTINPSLSGSFASSDTRFDGTDTFTVDYNDTYTSGGQILEYTYTSPSWSTLIGYWDPSGSNQANLMRPGINATPTPNNGVPEIVLAGDTLVLSILAESYKISSSSSRFCEGCQSTFTITTYGAIYSGSVTLSEDLSNSDNPSGTAGTFVSNNPGTPNIVTFAGNGADQTFTYTPETTSMTPHWTRINGTSAGPAITNNYIDINVTPATMRIIGPTSLHRGEYGDYTLIVYDPTISSVGLADWLNGSGNAADGTFADISSSPNPSGTFNSSTNTYNFSSCVTTGTDACVRTFRYTAYSSLSDAASYVSIEAESDTLEYTFLNVDIIANKITFSCSASNPNCTIAYVEESQVYNLRPNGVFTGSINITSEDAGASFSPSSTISWSNSSAAIGVVYTPSAPGRYILSANVTSSPDLNMNGKTFDSNTADSLNDYIWVIADQTTFFTGDDTIPNGGSGTYTLALNGPFVGTVILSDNDTVNGIPQGGSFDNGGICNFTFANYNPDSNTSTCTFVYTPTIEPEERTITLAPTFPPEFDRPMDITPIDITVYGFPDIRFISPSDGPSIGGNTVWITGAGLQGVSFITLGGIIENDEVVGGIPCTNLNILSDEMVTCVAPAHTAGTVNVFANNIIPPPDIDDTDPNDPIEIPRDPVQYTYFNVATDFINECDEDGNGSWTTTPYVVPGTTVDCRIVLNGRWTGPVTLSDDWHETIDPGLSGIFTSSDIRFDSGTNTFDVLYGDTADSTGQTLEYTWTSPPWGDDSSGLFQYWNPNRSNEDDLWWPMISVDIPIDEYYNIWLTSTTDDVVFGLLAQAYNIYPDGNYSYYCIDCEVDFIVSTYGAPYEGTISVTDILADSDDPYGTQGVFWAGGVPDNPGVMNFSGSDGADNSFSYIPATTAEGQDTFIRLQGTSSDPNIADVFYDIFPVLNPGITITPSAGCSFIARNQVCTYTLSVEFGAGMNWSGTVRLSDIFNIDDSPGKGVFADVSGISDFNPSGTFSPSTNTYLFTSYGGETYERTFTYTLRDDSVVGPLFPSHILQLTAESNIPNNQTFTNLFIYADRINTDCSLSYPNCKIGYVGKLQGYSFSPNGAMMGTANVTASDAGALGMLTWSTISANTHILYYTPTTPGRQVLTTTMEPGATPASMSNKSFASNDPESLNDYIWVMANQMTITGPSYLRYNSAGNFTLTMNGPFIGTIDLDDYIGAMSGPAAGGAISPTSCTFALIDYNSTTNTTSCNFTYTPYLFEDMTTVVLEPSITSYSGPLAINPLSVTVYGRPIIDSVSPDSGPTIGGTGFDVSYNPSGVITLTGTNLATGSSLNFDSLFMGNIPVPLGNINIIDNDNITFIPPPNSAGGVDIVVTAGSHVYHHPDYYTYIPEVDSISPIIGPTTGGTGFGASYNPNGTVTITGADITNSPRYSDGTKQYYGLGWLDFTDIQYINTGVNQLGNTKMTLDATRDSGMYAAGVLVAGQYFSIYLPDSGFRLPSANYGNVNVTAGGAMNSGDRILATLEADGTSAEFTVSLNGGPANVNTLNPTTLPNTPYNIFLGSGNNGAGPAVGMAGRIYSFTIEKDNPADSRNFVPVCTMDGITGGMFDTLHNVFYPSNAVSAPFTCDNSSITPPTVVFGGTAASPTSVTVIDLNTITVIPPSHAAGLVDVDVIVNGITATLTDAYTYRMPLTIFAVDPPYGPIAGGTALTITGDSFVPLSGSPTYTVTLDIEGTSANCASVNVVNNNTITCTTTAYPAGLVSVTVDNDIEIYTMPAVADPAGNGMPTLDNQGRSTGGFLYVGDTAIDLALSADSVDLTVTLSVPFDEDYIIAAVSTNAANGYRLYMESTGSTLVCSANGTIPAIPSTSVNTIGNGTWGYQVGTSVSSTGWAAAPTTSTQIDSSSSPTYTTPGPLASRDTRINFAVRNGNPTPINTTCPEYSQTITYTAVADP
ncbi:glycine-rich protein [Candidatus Saccharibacteria bacterium]|nr:glycine-rich protein [Candidatus Saccharibacteria bacterium]